MRTLFLSLGIAFIASAGAATPITITGGSADLTPSGGIGGVGQFSITGAGLSFTGHGSVSGVVCNFFPTCPAGSSFNVDTAISSEDQGLSGTVIFGGNTFNYSAGAGQSTTASLDLMYVLTIPGGGTSFPSTLTLISPFTGFGGITSPAFNGGQDLLVSGQGTATLALTLISAPPGTPPAYRLQSAHYEFTAVPEPGTATLILMGFAGFGIIARRVL